MLKKLDNTGFEVMERKTQMRTAASLTTGSVVHDGEDVDEEGDAVDEWEGAEAGFQGLLLLEDKGVEEHVESARHDARQYGGHEPGGHCCNKDAWLGTQLGKE